MTWDEWLAQADIADSLPLTFSSGRQRWTKITVYCGDCKAECHELRGTIDPQYGPVAYREAPPVIGYLMLAQGHCERCHSLTKFHASFHDDMTFTQYDHRTGEAIRTERLVKVEKKKPWWKRW